MGAILAAIGPILAALVKWLQDYFSPQNQLAREKQAQATQTAKTEAETAGLKDTYERIKQGPDYPGRDVLLAELNKRFSK